MTKEDSNKVINFPRHLYTPPKKMSLPMYLEYKYEKTFNEPWADLEQRVLARHPEFAIFKEPEVEENRKWWQIWK